MIEQDHGELWNICVDLLILCNGEGEEEEEEEERSDWGEF